MKLGPYTLPDSYTGDCRELLEQLPDESVQCVVTSPPYWGLRDYGACGQIGLEETPTNYVVKVVDVFREVMRVLRGDGTLWLNLGDSYASDTKGSGGTGKGTLNCGPVLNAISTERQKLDGTRRLDHGLKPKDLVGIPWRVAFALQAAGWYLRSDIIWAKPNPMPESVTDRPTKSHEYLFLLTKSARYYYDADAVREAHEGGLGGGRQYAQRNGQVREKRNINGQPHGKDGHNMYGLDNLAGRNKRSVWTVNSRPYSGAHFACFPPKLIEPCILAGSKPGDVVLDPFFGSGTTGEVAEKHGRLWLGFDINPEYKRLQDERTSQRSLPGVNS